MKVLIFGIGNHGGGIGAARYFLSRGDAVTVSDSAPAQRVPEALRALTDTPVEWELGGHRKETFDQAELIIKNPAVTPDHPLLAGKNNVESAFSYVLKRLRIPVIAITGTKGKSTTASVLSSLFADNGFEPLMIGNMGISPFTILDIFTTMGRKEQKKAVVVAELSSWQLRDLASYTEKGSAFFTHSILTSLFPDHMNSYGSFDEYRRDKFQIFSFLRPGGTAIIPENEAAALQRAFPEIESVTTFPQSSKEIPKRLIPAFAAAEKLGLTLRDTITAELPHRQENLGIHNAVRYVNDSAATVPQAVSLALENLLPASIHLITGGTDKNLDPLVLIPVLPQVSSIHLLDGSYTKKLIPLLEKERIHYNGPFRTMEGALASAQKKAEFDVYKDRVILLSPGAASFELFLNEFDRGDQFRNLL